MGSVYDIDKIQRRLMGMFVNATPPNVNPIQLRALIAYQREVTDLASDHRTKVAKWLMERFAPSQGDWLQLEAIDKRMSEWKVRLAAYESAVASCTDDDAECTLWTVTAPEFYGFFGGASSTEPARAADLMEPMKIANSLGELVAADVVHNVDAAIDAVWEATKKAPGVVSDAVNGAMRGMGAAAGSAAGGVVSELGKNPIGIVAAIVAGLFGLWWVFGRPKESED